MKKNYNFLLLLISCMLYSQVGLNTKNPQGVFHIDGLINNPLSSAPNNLQQTDDVVVSVLGNVGLGTITPTKKLAIISGGTKASPLDGFKLQDGTQGAGNVLVSDEDGSAHWERFPAIKLYNGLFGNGHDIDLSNTLYNFNPGDYSVSFYQTGSYIDLQPGIWNVKINILLSYLADSELATLSEDQWFWVRSTLSDNGTSSPAMPSPDLVGSSKWASEIFQGPTPPLSKGNKLGLINGTLVLRNLTNDIKRYYLLVGGLTKSTSNLPGAIQKMGGNIWSENEIIAHQIE